jgi:heptaprenyl diphosphate synthase
MLSRFSIRQDLKLPGTFGALISESFQMLEKINERKGMITRKNIIGGIDQLMMELSADEETLLPEEAAPTRYVQGSSVQKQSLLGIIILICICIIIWSITIFFYWL